MTAALSIVSAVALTTAMTFYTANTKAQSTPSLSGSCGFVANPQKWGFVPIAGNKYDWGIGYGVYNFDTRTVIYANSDVDVKIVGTEPSYSERIITYKITVTAHPDIPNTYKIGSEVNNDYMTVISTNGGNTLLFAGRRGDSTGVCQKI